MAACGAWVRVAATKPALMSMVAATTLLLCSVGNACHSDSPAAWSLPGTTSKTLNCGAGLQERETLARWRPARALGRVGALGCAKAVPPSHRLQTDSGAHQRTGSVGAA